MIVALFGPTGVGKTEIGIELAGLLRAGGRHPVAVSADAMQVYEGLDTLAAKPTPEQLDQLEHRLLSYVPISREHSVAEFAQAAHAEIDGLLTGGATPIVVGGTGLYLRAAVAELDLRPPPEPGLRRRLERELAEAGPAALHARLGTRTAAVVHPNDRKRIVRALELELTGSEPHRSSEQLWSKDLRRPTALFGITMDRDALARRISARARGMLDGAAVAEVESAIEAGASRTARKALGFREIAAHLVGELDASETRELLERRHLAYVKRQLTWMRKLASVAMIDRTGMSAAAAAETIAARLGVGDEGADPSTLPGERPQDAHQGI
jgi:tRNA dimethylallyltransferase